MHLGDELQKDKNKTEENKNEIKIRHPGNNLDRFHDQRDGNKNEINNNGS